MELPACPSGLIFPPPSLFSVTPVTLVSPAVRRSTQRANDRYKGHLDEQLITQLDIPIALGVVSNFNLVDLSRLIPSCFFLVNVLPVFFVELCSHSIGFLDALASLDFKLSVTE